MSNQNPKRYCGNARALYNKETGEYFGLKISICLDDLEESDIVEAKNGKRYVNLNATLRREADQYGNDHSVSIDDYKKESTPQTPHPVRTGPGPQYGAPVPRDPVPQQQDRRLPSFTRNQYGENPPY